MVATAHKVTRRRITVPTLSIPISEWNQGSIPGHDEAQRGTGYVRVTDIPRTLNNWLAVNPRTPKPIGAVPRAIAETLAATPEQFILKNAGIYILADEARESGGNLDVSLTDPKKHGIINGGHTYITIAKIVDEASEEDKIKLASAFVPVHVFTGIARDNVLAMADGLNRTRQVQEASLENLRGHYDTIKTAMKSHWGSEDIAYHEGDTGTVNISEVLAFLEIFNFERYPSEEHPHRLYAHRSRVIHEAAEDFGSHVESVGVVVKHLPDILKLADSIRFNIPPLLPAKARAETSGKMRLPFLHETIQNKIPNGWLYPILASFRANVNCDQGKGKFTWIANNDALLRSALPGLVSICQSEQRVANHKPEWVGKRESAYRQCRLHTELILQKLMK